MSEKNLKSSRILLVEDHEPTRRVLTQLLVRRRYEVVSVASLAEAKRVAECRVFDLLIADIGLSDGSGQELMADLRARWGLKGIAVSGYGQEEDLARSRAAGFVTHLTKPVSIQSLEHAIALASSA
jgi:CheY-like chemotaxis protein